MRRSLILLTGAAALTFGTAAPAQQAATAPKPLTRAMLMANADQAFANVDTNHDGSVTAPEIQAAQTKELQQLRAAIKARAEAQFKSLDTNKDGQLSLAEFLAVLPQVNTTGTPAQVLQKLDSNHDGKVSLEEFKAPRIADFNKADTNHDGVVSVEEQRKAAGQK